MAWLAWGASRKTVRGNRQWHPHPLALPAIPLPCAVRCPLLPCVQRVIALTGVDLTPASDGPGGADAVRCRAAIDSRPAGVAGEEPLRTPPEGCLEALAARVRAFAVERDWEQFHTPKNLVMALSAEVGEVLEIFQWEPAQSHLARSVRPPGSASTRRW
jgi:hypothetical protein